jgi:cell division protein FtsB
MAQFRRLHAGTWIGLIIALYIAYYLIITIKHNYELQKQVTGLKGQITDLQDQQTDLKYKIQYYQTDSYKEKEARAKLGLQAPGEGVVILPHSDDTHVSQLSKKPAPKKSNVQQWFDFLTGKATPSE